MAKTLIGLYDTFGEAERVVQDLLQHDFARSDVRLATQSATRAAGRATDQAYVREDMVSSGGPELVEELTDLGVPTPEASAYAEGVRRGGTLVVVTSSDEAATRGLEILQRLQPVDIDERVAQWRKEGWTHTQSSAMPHTAADVSQERPRARQQRADAGESTIPVVEEELSVDKREVERGRVRIHSRVEERPVEESVRLREERVIVERHPVDRPATDAEVKAAREETIEVTETVEEPVVSKQARVVEEVTVRKEAQEHTETVRETVRRQDVDVEQGGTAHPPEARSVEADAATFRRHHAATFIGSGTSYEDYEPAYHYGYDFGRNERYRGRDWAAVEAEARRDWEARRPGTWERFKDAIRHGWESRQTESTAEPGQTARTTARRGFETYAPDFRQHCTATFAGGGAGYTDYEPAYRYGYNLGTSERYRGRDWAAVEAEARRDWETRRPDTWERFKDAIRYGWDKVRARA